MMIRLRFKKRLVICGVVINFILIILFNMYFPYKTELLPDFSVNASKHFIQKFVPLPIKKPVVSFEIGRPKPKGGATACRFTQSDGLQSLAEKYLYPDKETGKCENNYQSICSISGSVNAKSSISVSCEENPCKSDTVMFGSLNEENGELQWEHVRSNNLESFINSFGIKAISSMHPFFFLKCGEHNTTNIDSLHFTQLITLPILEHRNVTTPTQPSTTNENINVNILYLNSVSRRHFYRSLPKTIESFRNINLNPKSTSNVLDFELYQALNTSRETTLLDVMDGKKVDGFAESLLHYFHDAGYQTLWQEDRCWKFEHSHFSKSFIGKNSKEQKKEIITKLKNINTIGMTHSSCFAFQSNGVNTAKKYGQQNICVNGKLHHEYFLEFVTKYLGQVDSDKSVKSLFSFTSFNLGFEETGKHIQILDRSLASFVEKTATDINTITFLLSSHGNKDTNFPVQTNEGQYEQYNPFLFVIVPKFVERQLPEVMKNNLYDNQVNLLSITDISDTIKSLLVPKQNTNTSKGKGLFEEFPLDRNCEKLRIASSSLCICDGWNSVQTLNTFHFIIAEFALGEMNNKIVGEFHSQCQHLYGVKISNVTQKRLANGYIEIDMDIFVQRNEVFAVKVKWHGDNNSAMKMTLIYYHRKTLKSTTRPCYVKDKHICLCKSHNDRKAMVMLNQGGRMFGRRSRSENRHNHCLYIMTRDYQDSTVFEGFNLCDNVEYHVQVNFELDDMRTPGTVPVNATISPQTIQFLTFVTPFHLKKSGSWEYEITFDVRTVKKPQ